MMEHVPRFKVDAVRKALAALNVPEYSVNRLVRVLTHHDEGNYEESTYLGVPLLDELAIVLYAGKAFTTKRRNKRRDRKTVESGVEDTKPKPELAYKSAKGPDLSSYSLQFIQAFGSLQEDPDHALLDDANYWNRHAIVHGMMRRPMGIKDSAKCLMAIKFLLFAKEREDEAEKPNEDASSQRAGDDE